LRHKPSGPSSSLGVDAALAQLAPGLLLLAPSTRDRARAISSSSVSRTAIEIPQGLLGFEHIVEVVTPAKYDLAIFAPNHHRAVLD